MPSSEALMAAFIFLASLGRTGQKVSLFYLTPASNREAGCVCWYPKVCSLHVATASWRLTHNSLPPWWPCQQLASAKLHFLHGSKSSQAWGPRKTGSHCSTFSNSASYPSPSLYNALLNINMSLRLAYSQRRKLDSTLCGSTQEFVDNLKSQHGKMFTIH